MIERDGLYSKLIEGLHREFLSLDQWYVVLAHEKI